MVMWQLRTSATEGANRIFEQSDKNQVGVVMGSGKDRDGAVGPILRLPNSFLEPQYAVHCVMPNVKLCVKLCIRNEDVTCEITDDTSI